MNYPFTEKNIDKETVVRLFESSVAEDDLIWHRDRQNRIVEVLSGNGWKLQLDNKLPIELCEGDCVYIPAGVFHRLILGDTDLKLQITEKKKIDQNKDGKNDFEDVKIARMKASGMSDDEIKEKFPELFEKKRPGRKQYYTGTRKSNKEMEREIKKCSVPNPPKSCYGDWTADKTFRKAGKKTRKSKYTEATVIKEYIKEILLNEKLSKQTRSTLKKKADENNMPLGALTAVYRKGLAAWLTGHRQGVAQHQWAMGRVNSFIKGGKARKVDAEQWEKVKKHRKKK